MNLSKIKDNVDADRAKLLNQDRLERTSYEYCFKPIAELSPREKLFTRIARPALKATLVGGIFLTLASGTNFAKSTNELRDIDDHISQEIDDSRLGEVDKKIGLGTLETKDLGTIFVEGRRIISSTEKELINTTNEVAASILGLSVGATASSLSTGGLILVNRRRKAKSVGLYNSSRNYLSDSTTFDYTSKLKFFANKYVSRVDQDDDSEVYEIRDYKKSDEFRHNFLDRNKMYKVIYKYIKYMGYGVLTAVALSTPIAEEVAVKADDAVAIIPGKEDIANKIAGLADPMVKEIKEDTIKGVVSKISETMPNAYAYVKSLGIKEQDFVELAINMTEDIKPGHIAENERTEIFSEAYYTSVTLAEDKLLYPSGLESEDRPKYYAFLTLPILGNLLIWFNIKSRYGKKTLITENFLKKHLQKDS